MFTANRKWQISNPILKEYVVNNCWLLKIGANRGINLMNQLVTLFSKKLYILPSNLIRNLAFVVSGLP